MILMLDFFCVPLYNYYCICDGIFSGEHLANYYSQILIWNLISALLLACVLRNIPVMNQPS